MRSRSLRVNLTILNFIIMGLFLSVFSCLLYITLSTTLKEELDEKLRSIAEAMATTQLRAPMAKMHKSPSIDEMLEYMMGSRYYGKFIQIIDRSGNVGDRSKNLERRKLPVSKEALFNASKGLVYFNTIHFEGEEHPIRVITYPNIKFNRVTNIIQIGSSMENVEVTLDRFMLILFLLVPFALLVISFSGWFMASKALEPVDRITRSARKITAENLSQRIKPTEADDEIGRLVDTINDMISRLEISFNQVLQFSADVSHELRTPLTILKGGAEVILKQKRSLEEYEDLIVSSLEEINRMQRIVEGLLMLSRADMGESSITKERVDLNKILEALRVQAEMLAMEKNIAIDLELKSVIVLKADEIKIRQLLLNIISNAIKYSNSNSEIRIRAYEEAGYAVISVRDFGIGITEKDIPYLFNRFFRVDKGRSREEGGTGLGLSICKWIAKEHGGDIYVESELGKGSTFTVKLALGD
jgi:heavy metal sensor kinase